MSGSPSSSRTPVAPVVFNDALPPLSPDQWYSESEQNFRRDHYDRVRYNGEHLDGPLADRYSLGRPEGMPMTPTEHAAEMELDAHCRATNGGLPDAPDDGGPRAVSSSPFKF